MDKFDYRRPATPQEAVMLLAREPGARLLAGGTDLLPLMKENLASPAVVIDLSAWKEGSEIEESAAGLRIGSMSTLASIAAHPTVRTRYTALADACTLSASPQLRNMGTIGGNLMQQTRCWYYRGAFNCWLKGGDSCFARNGENEQHAIFHTDPAESPCVSAHPSDPAAALLALEALLEYVSPTGVSILPLSELYMLPTASRRSFTTLPADGLITSIIIPRQGSTARSIYRIAMPRAAWSFALAGTAVVLALEEETIVEARIALSGVAPVPIRATGAEQHMTGRKLEELDLTALSAALTASAAPLAMNGYKVSLLEGLFRQTFAELAGSKA